MKWPPFLQIAGKNKLTVIESTSKLTFLYRICERVTSFKQHFITKFSKPLDNPPVNRSQVLKKHHKGFLSDETIKTM